MKALQVFITALGLLGGSSVLQAQRISLSRWEFGAGAGIFLYQGDLAPARFGGYKDPKLGLNLFVSRIMNANLALRAQFSHSTLKTDESDYSKPEWRQQRNLAFKTPLNEFSLLAVWHTNGDQMEEPNLKVLSPYIFAGGGLSVLNVRRDFTRFSSDYFNTQPSVIAGVAADMAHRTPRVIPVIPVGAGVKYPVSTKVSLMAEASYRLGFNDYIDGVSQAANPRKNDHYYSVSVGVTYRPFRNRGIGCPSVQ